MSPARSCLTAKGLTNYSVSDNHEIGVWLTGRLCRSDDCVTSLDTCIEIAKRKTNNAIIILIIRTIIITAGLSNK